MKTPTHVRLPSSPPRGHPLAERRDFPAAGARVVTPTRRAGNTFPRLPKLTGETALPLSTASIAVKTKIDEWHRMDDYDHPDRSRSRPARASTRPDGGRAAGSAEDGPHERTGVLGPTVESDAGAAPSHTDQRLPSRTSRSAGAALTGRRSAPPRAAPSAGDPRLATGERAVRAAQRAHGRPQVIRPAASARVALPCPSPPSSCRPGSLRTEQPAVQRRSGPDRGPVPTRSPGDAPDQPAVPWNFLPGRSRIRVDSFVAG
ncbi:hypothetical protein GA0074704_4164 [Micromonospora siamensis]|uniref:Uncharacterized protein n=1 Tax=Micromonospora siamensis TaxID=299152 RepID=A0A1C5J626_9ACTN|nr:hypothetical protein GA0074704_4164 [Micromonospora siamensis]